MRRSRGKLTISGGKKKSYNIGGFIIDGQLFIGQDVATIGKSGVALRYAIYTLGGKMIEGGFDSATDAIGFAHVWAVREKFKL